MDNLASLVIISLASWRLAHLLVMEDGPFAIFEKLRLFIGLKPGPVSGFLPLLFSCVVCMSFWTTVTAYVLWRVEPIITILIAAMAIVAIIHIKFIDE